MKTFALRVYNKNIKLKAEPSMLEIQNRNYAATERVDSASYWLSQLSMRSHCQDLKSTERDILGSAFVMAAPDIRSVWVSAERETANLLTLGVNLEADDEQEAMVKASGLALLAVRKAGVDIESMILTDGRIASGGQLADDAVRDPTASLQDSEYVLTSRLSAVFTDIQACMIRYGSPATY